MAGSLRAAGMQVGRTGEPIGRVSHWKSSVEDALEVAPRIGVHRNTHRSYSQRGRGSTRFYSTFRCAPGHPPFGPPRDQHQSYCLEKHPKQWEQYKGCTEAPELVGCSPGECFAIDCKHEGSCARNWKCMRAVAECAARRPSALYCKMDSLRSSVVCSPSC